MGRNPGRLTRLDEWPRHQTARTFDSVASDSPHWSDGFYFTAGDPATGTTLFSGLRLYPNTDVLDAFACLVVDGRQHNVRASRRLRPRSDDLDAGPLGVEIVRGLERLRTTCAAGPHGVAFELDWTGLHPPYLEDEVVRYSGGRLVYHRANFDQCCALSGWVEAAGRRIDVDPGWVGVRDHSWGLGRTGGPASAAIAPAQESDPRRGFALRQWVMLRMPGRVLFWQLHQRADGGFEQLEARALPLDGGEPVVYTGARLSVDRVGSSVRMAACTVELTGPNGVERYLLDAVGAPAYLQGGGYHEGFADGLGRGVFRGDDHLEHEVWDVSAAVDVVDPSGTYRPRPDAWAEQFATCTNLDDPADSGFGHVECVLGG